MIGFRQPESAPAEAATNQVTVSGNLPPPIENKNVAMVSPTHYAVPKAATKIRIQLVPDFHKGKHDMGK